MRKLKLYIIALLLVAITPMAVLADNNPPSIPLTIYGDVKIDNNVAPINTVISVFNNNIEVARTIINQAGKYFIEVGAENKGQILTYKINDSQAMQAICADPLITPTARIDLIIPVINSNQSLVNNNGGYFDSSNLINNNLTPTTVIIPVLLDSITIKPEQQVLGVKINVAEDIINKILEEAKLVKENNFGNVVRDLALEKNIEKKYYKMLIKNLKANELINEQKNILIKFITYGTATTKKIGTGERVGVINSYKATFNKLPMTENEWADVVKIANGRWPNERNIVAEKKAKTFFKKIYGREVMVDNKNDSNAITVITYGLLPTNRKNISEKNAILSFKRIFKYTPNSASDWNIVRAIAYSGAKK